MNNQEVHEIVNSIKYKDNWKIVLDEEEGRLFLRWRFLAKCVKSKAEGWVYGRTWRLSKFMTESELVQTALMAALAVEEHEAREHFLYKGKRVFNPHIDVNKMLEICEFEDGRA